MSDAGSETVDEADGAVLSTPEAARAVPRQRRQIFVSYSRADRLAVDRLCADLTRLDHYLWVDSAEHGIEAGENWRDELRMQVSASDALIACLSPDYFKSEFCKAEVTQALAEGKPIFPVKLRRLTLDEETAGLTAYAIADLQYIDLSATIEAYDTGLRRLRRKLPPPSLMSMPRIKKLARAMGVVLALLGVFALGAVTAVWAIIESRPDPSVAGHNIGIIVAEFERPTDGSVDQADGLAVVQRFASLLDRELDAALEPLRLTYGLLGPETVRQVDGDLRDFAAKYGADVVIYGQIRRDDAGQLVVEPRFYLNPDTFTDALEMVGASRFGSPVRLVDTRAGTAEQALSTRSVALTQVVIGLSRYLLGDYSGALQSFERANETAGLEDQRIEVVLAMLGSARLKVASEYLSRGDIEDAEPLLVLAEQAYRDALTVDTEYARAYTGIAAAEFLQWNAAFQRGDQREQRSYPGVEVLNDAIQMLDRGAEAIQQPNRIYQTRALLPRMQIQYARWAFYSDDIPPDDYAKLPDDINRTAASVLAFYENGTQPAVQDVAAEAYKFIGLIAFGQNDCDAAITAFEQGIQLAPPLSRAYMAGWIADCLRELGDDSALARYEAALQLALTANAPQDMIDLYRQAIEELSGRG